MSVIVYIIIRALVIMPMVMLVLIIMPVIVIVAPMPAAIRSRGFPALYEHGRPNGKHQEAGSGAEPGIEILGRQWQGTGSYRLIRVSWDDVH